MSPDTGRAMTPMPQYQSHKRVWALKIKSVQHIGGETPSVIMHFEDQTFSPRQESTLDKPKPEVGWYMVQYDDGYLSFSPAVAFESGNHRLHVEVHDISRAARICHEANRAYCESIGDFSQVPYEAAAGWQKNSAKMGVRLHLTELEEGRIPQPRASHEAWLEVKRTEGWTFGPVKDADKKEHPCFVPYEELPAEQQAKDFIFVGIVTSMFKAGVLGNNPPKGLTNAESDMDLPTVGRIVHYHSYGTPGGEYKPLPRAAVVSEILEDDPEGTVGLVVLNPTGEFFNRHTPYSPVPKPGHWNWPLRK